MNFGVRVVRGPDWKWKDQDGGEGHVGTVIKPLDPESLGSQRPRPGFLAHSGTVLVRWDCGNEKEVGGFVGNYRIEKYHDLRILDSSAAGVEFSEIGCSECRSTSIKGTLWRCSVCDDCDLCTRCYMNNAHDLSHQFCRYDLPRRSGVLVSSRSATKKSDYYGIYYEAEVFRDVDDWLKSGQDGGMGTLGDVLGQAEEPGMVKVKWENRLVFEHHLGRDGKVDLWTINPKRGGSYYMDHLAELDIYHFSDEERPPPDGISSNIPAEPVQSSYTEQNSSEILVEFQNNASDASSHQGAINELAQSMESKVTMRSNKELAALDSKQTEKKDNDVREILNVSIGSANSDGDLSHSEYCSADETVENGNDGGENSNRADIIASDDELDDSDDSSSGDINDSYSDDNDLSESEEEFLDDTENDYEEEDDNAIFRSAARDLRRFILQNPEGQSREVTEMLLRMIGEDSLSVPTARQQRGFERGRISQGEICKGDKVLIDPDLDPTSFQRLQEEPGAGGWNRDMRHLIGKVVTFKEVVPGRSIVVEAGENSRLWHLNPKAITSKIYSPGDIIRLTCTDASLKQRQKGHGGWIPEMKQMLGQYYTVANVEPDGSGMMIRYRPGCDLELNPWSCTLETPAAETVEGAGLTAQEVERLLSGGLDPRAPVDQRGNSFLHSVIFKSDNPAVLAFLLDRFPDAAELVNMELQSLLHCAVKKRRINCVRLLFKRGLNLNYKDLEGNTPLHCAIKESLSTLPDPLVEALTEPSRFDYGIINESHVNVLQQAALGDHAFAARRIIAMAPTLLDGSREVKVQGYEGISSPMLLACCSGSLEVIKVIIAHNRKYLEKPNSFSDQSPLMTAIIHRNAEVAEFLISEGANVNVVGRDGDTCLHIILRHITAQSTPFRMVAEMTNIEKAPETLQIYRNLPRHFLHRTWIAMVCFLISQGADLHRLNRSGATPLSFASNYGQELTELLTYFFTVGQQQLFSSSSSSHIISFSGGQSGDKN